MESINTTDDDTYSWRDILITLTLATSILLFFFLRQRSTPPQTSSSSSSSAASSLSEEERRKRREHLAAIAEERAVTKRLLQEQSDDHETTVFDGVEKEDIIHKDGSISSSVKKQSDDERAAVKPTKGNNDPPRNDIQTHHAKEEERIDNPVGAKGRDVDHEKVENKEQKEEKELVVVADSADGVIVAGDAGKESDDDSGDMADDDDGVVSGVKGEADASMCEVGTMRENVNDNEEVTNDDEVDFEATTDDKDQSTTEGDTGHRERHAKAIANIMAKKTKQNRKKPASVPSLTIHLILTSSPNSPRMELSIPTTATTASLRRRVSHASGVPEAELKLIFRGRFITTTAEGEEGRSVVEEFDIENGSALHVLGKPRLQPTEEEDDGGSEEGEGNSNPGEEEGSDSEEESNSEEEVVPSSDTRTRSQIMADIRTTSSKSYYHRAAERGDLDALREAVDTGFSNVLHVADSNGWTPLHEAVRAGHVHVVEYLVREVGLDVDEVTNQGNGWSALSLALEHHGANHPVTVMVQTLLHRTDPPAPANPWGDLHEEMYD